MMSIPRPYMGTISETVTLDDTATVSAKDMVEKGTQLQVSITEASGSGNTFAVTNGKTTELPYSVPKSANLLIAVGDMVLAVNPDVSANGSAELLLSKSSQIPPFAGAYTGTVIFTVAGNPVT